MHKFDGLIKIAPELASALAEGRPVVALESTIITHGTPYPANGARRRRCCSSAWRRAGNHRRDEGSLRVGFGEDLLRRLAEGRDVCEASRRDLAALVATGATAGTTVSATASVAARCRIAIFATGGIGAYIAVRRKLSTFPPT
jgi:pseudouridine-5'-phosphate glycosidase